MAFIEAGLGVRTNPIQDLILALIVVCLLVLSGALVWDALVDKAVLHFAGRSVTPDRLDVARDADSVECRPCKGTGRLAGADLRAQLWWTLRVAAYGFTCGILVGVTIGVIVQKIIQVQGQ